MHKDSVLKEKLVVQPMFVTLQHKNVFMGPCRYGSGEELTYDFDHMMALKQLEFLDKDLEKYIDHDLVEVLETKYIEWHEDFAIPESVMKEALSNKDEVDVYLISGTRLISYVSTIIAKRTNKPIAFCPLSNAKQSRLGGIDASAHLHALGFHETYNALSYDDLNRVFRLLRTRKALKDTKMLYALRNNVLSFGAVSSFINLQDITDRFGTEILNYNGMEFFKVMDEFTEEENEEAKALAHKLVSEANAVHMPAENIINDCKFYLAVNKVLKQFDCNSFTIPCFEMCATQELNKRHLTFCLTHSLLKDEGIPSSCAGDVGAAIALDIMMNLTFKSPHMGNCMVMLDKVKENQMRILHDVSTRCMKGYDQPLDVDYVSFTKGNWGATMRYDFSKDNGQPITLINLSPKMDKIMIGKGEINGCDDFLTQECKHAIEFTVKDAVDFHKKQEYFGHHFVWVYGDYVEDLKDFAKMMDMEVVLA